jgi:uncharacterized protein (DUF924 family)
MATASATEIWTRPSWRATDHDDEALLAQLPNAARTLVERFAGVWLDGALHIRGACDDPPWHSLRAAWHGAQGVNARHGLSQDDIPLAQTTFGDELVLRGYELVRIVAETGRHEPLGASVGGLIAELERDAARFLRLDAASREPRAEWEPLLAFWFEDCGAEPLRIQQLVPRWFAGGADFDAALRERFEPLLERAERAGLAEWSATPRGTLAAVLVLDQLSRNLRRGDARSFALDARAHALARNALERGVDQRLRAVEAAFLYLPLEHAESLDDQRRCVELFERLCERAPAAAREAFDGFADYARRHLAVIERFGRFPHRNDVLGRETRSQEACWLAEGGDTF